MLSFSLASFTCDISDGARSYKCDTLSEILVFAIFFSHRFYIHIHVDPDLKLVQLLNFRIFCYLKKHPVRVVFVQIAILQNIPTQTCLRTLRKLFVAA